MYTFAQYIHIHIYMHIKHQKTEEVVSLWLWQTVNCFYVFIFLIFVCVCVCVLTGCTGSGREAITAGPRFMGHHPKACWRRRFRTRVSYLSSSCAGELSGSEASASAWAWGSPHPPFSSPQLSVSTLARKRMENGEAGGLSNMTKVVWI